MKKTILLGTIIALFFVGSVMGTSAYLENGFSAAYCDADESTLEPMSNALIGGTVTFRDGPPVEGVSIMYFSMTTIDSVVTDRDGKYEIPIDAPAEVNLFPMYFDGTIEPITISASVAPGDTIMDYDFFISTPAEPDAWITGRITDSTDEPLAGASISAFSGFDLYSETSGPDGSYRINVPGGSDYSVSCELYGYSSEPEAHLVTVDSGATVSDVDFTMHDSTSGMATVYGSVLYSDGSAPSSGEVNAEGMSSPFISIVEIDPGGNYEIELPEGEYRLFITPWSTTPPEHYVDIETSDMVGPVNFTIMDTIGGDLFVSGHITYDDSRPAVGIPVEAYGYDYFTTVTDAEGYYQFDLPLGYWEIYCYVDGYIVDPEYHEIEGLEPDSIVDLDFLLKDPPPPDAVITGRITFDDGTGAEGFTVDAYSDEFYFSTESDADGYYYIDAIGGVAYEIEVDIWGEYISDPSYYEEYLMASDTLEDINFVLMEIGEPDAYFTGNVRFEDGSPAIGINISAWGWDTDLEYYTTTDSDGNYTLPVLGIGSYEIYPDLVGDLTSEPEYYDREIDSGDTISALDFVLSDGGGEEAEIMIYIHDEDDTPIADIEINIEGEESGFYFSSRTAYDGILYAFVMESDFYNILPMSDEYEFDPEMARIYVDGASVSVDFLASPMDTIEPDCHFYFYSHDSTDAPFPGIVLNWRKLGDPDWNEATTLIDGYAHVPLPGIGNYEIEVTEPTGYNVLPNDIFRSITESEPVDTVDLLVIPEYGIDEKSDSPDELKLSVFPNPFNSSLYIEKPSGKTAIIRDTSGRIIERTKSNYWNPGKNVESGVYMISIDGDDSEIKAIYIK